MLEVLKGRHSAFGASSKDAVDSALRHAHRALELDPNFALAWSALADCQSLRARRGMAPPAEAGAEATAAARRALELDPVARRCARVARPHPRARRRCARRASARSTRRSSSIPGSPSLTTCWSRVLLAFERHAEALAAANLLGAARPAVDADPHRGGRRVLLRARVREVGRSTTAWRSSSIRGSTARTPTSRARSRRSAGSTRRARSTRKGRRLAGGVAGPIVRAGAPRGRRGERGGGAAHPRASSRRRAARASCPRGGSPRCTRAWATWTTHSTGSTSRSTEKATGLIFLRVHPRLDPIRGDPRYWPLVRRVGLADD